MGIMLGGNKDTSILTCSLLHTFIGPSWSLFTFMVFAWLLCTFQFTISYIFIALPIYLSICYYFF